MKVKKLEFLEQNWLKGLQMIQFGCPRVIHYVPWACWVIIHAQNVIRAPPASRGVQPGEVREKGNSAAAVRKNSM